VQWLEPGQVKQRKANWCCTSLLPSKWNVVNRLEHFPGALCDQLGFLRIETEKSYLPHPDIRVGA
jgi:hypothetical protein